MKLKSLILFHFLFLSIGVLQAQVIEVDGKISSTESDDGLMSATVVFSSLKESKILGYGITNPEGIYNVKFKSVEDSLQVKISYLGYETFEKKIAAKNQKLDIKLKPSAETLEEVFLRRPPIQQRGDTLVFDPEAFKNLKDRSIQDVMARMPGVEISPEGLIEYQGKPINKFYVEGLDLMEGQYGMIAKNLSADKVSSVEILENHQPIKSLEDIEPSENAAINIRLKNNVTMSGNATVGGGATPGLWYANVVPMLFLKNHQALISYQTNNTGEDLERGFRSFSIRSFRFGQRSDSRQNWLSTASASAPGFSSNRWLDNTSHLASINLLFKDKKETEFRIKTSYLNDFRKREGGRITTYLLPEGDIVIDDNTYNHTQAEKFETSLSVERNSKNDFLRNELKLNKQWDGAFASLIQNSEAQNHRLQNPFMSVSNNLERMFSFGSQLLTVNSNIGYNETPQNLKLSPGVFEDILNSDMAIDLLKQDVFHKRFFANHSVSFTKKFGKTSLDFRPGLDFTTQSMESEMSVDNVLFDNIDYQNDVRWRQMKAYLGLSAFYRGDKLNISLRAPLEWNNYQIEDKLRDTKTTKSPFTLNPSANIQYEFASYWRAFVSGSYNKSHGPVDNLYSGYLLTNYRSLNKREAPISEYSNTNGGFGITYRNPLTTWFARLNYNRSYGSNSQMTSNKLLPDGSSVLEFIDKKNTNTSDSFSGSVSKLVEEISTTFNYGINYSIRESDMLLNEEFYKNKTNSLTHSLKLSADVTNWLTLEYNGSLSNQKTSNPIRESRKLNAQNHGLGVFIFPAENHMLSFNSEWMQNKFGDEVREDFFGDFTYRFTFSEKKIDVDFSIVNIFDKDMYRDISIGDYTTSESYFKLRPRQFLVTLRLPL